MVDNKITALLSEFVHEITWQVTTQIHLSAPHNHNLDSYVITFDTVNSELFARVLFSRSFVK